MHRHDPQAARLAASLGGAIPSGNEEAPDSGLADTDRLLLDAPDGPDAAVEVDLAGGGDLPAVVDVLAQPFEHVEGEREAGGGPADVPRVDLDLQRQLDRCGRRDEDADDRSLRILGIGDRSHGHGRLSLAAADDQPYVRAWANAPDRIA